MPEKAMQNGTRAPHLIQLAIVFLLVLLAFTFGLALGGWQQTERFRSYLEIIPDINSCHDGAVM